MEYWHPMPQALTVDLLAHRWTPDHPAPEAVGFMVALDRMRAGHPWSIRRLATWAGWTRHRAHRVRDSARAYLTTWEDRTQPDTTSRPPIPNNPSNIRGRTGQKPDKKRTIPDITRADLQSQEQNSTQDRTRTRASNHPCPLEEDDRITAQDAEQFLARLHSFRR